MLEKFSLVTCDCKDEGEFTRLPFHPTLERYETERVAARRKAAEEVNLAGSWASKFASQCSTAFLSEVREDAAAEDVELTALEVFACSRWCSTSV